MSDQLALYWIPLGAGARVVRRSGRLYEALAAVVQRRPRCDLYHSVLIADTAAGRTVVEMARSRITTGRARGVVGEGPVGSHWLGRLRLFRYEIRRWPDGVIPDLPYTVASPVVLADDPAAVRRALDLVADVPTPVWGSRRAGRRRHVELELGDLVGPHAGGAPRPGRRTA